MSSSDLYKSKNKSISGPGLCSCIMFFFTHQRSQMPPTTQLLRSAEALTMPRVQVIVLNANMRCHECRDKVSKVLSKMDNLLNYAVDVTQTKVTVRGRVDPKKKRQRIRLMGNDEKRRKTIESERQLTGKTHSDDLEQQYCSRRWTVESTDNQMQHASCFRCASS